MLTDFEKMLFLLLALFSSGASYAGFKEMALIIGRGQGQLEFEGIARRAFTALGVYLTQRTTLKTRPMTSVIHWGVVLGFSWYFLVNAVDLLIGFAPGFERQLKTAGAAYDGFRFFSDVLSVIVLLGIVYFLLRRLLLPGKAELQFHDNVLLHQRVAAGGVKVDSLIVAAFILLHVGARFLGESVAVAQTGQDSYMPFASAASVIWTQA